MSEPSYNLSPGFKDPSRIKEADKRRAGDTLPMYHLGLFTGSPDDVVHAKMPVGSRERGGIIGGILDKYRKPAPSEVRLTPEIAPYYSNAAKIWNSVKNGKPTNAEVINMQAGDPNYYEGLVNHLSTIPGSDVVKSGMWMYPAGQMRQYGAQPAPTPVVFKRPTAGEGGSWSYKGELPYPKGRLVVADTTGAEFKESAKPNSSPSVSPIKPGSRADKGNSFLHEFTHSNYMPYKPFHLFERGNRNDWDAFKYNKQAEAAVNGGIASPMFDAEKGNVARIPEVGTPGDYKGMMPPGHKPVNPQLSEYNGMLPESGTYSNGLPLGSGAYSDAYNHDEIVQGLASLNRAQHLLQQNIKKNPQAYIDAGYTRDELDRFLKLPTFLKSPEQLDQRMEFYHNNPHFAPILGTEPARIIPQYFMLYREMQNQKNPADWRDLHRRQLKFMRDNYFIGNNNLRNDPMNTGMGRLYSSLA